MGQAWESRGVCRWIAYRRSDGALAGRGGLSFAQVDGQERLELGWTVASSMWGQGYATEIGQAGLAFAFTDLGASHVVAFAKPRNQRSISVIHKLGMRYTRDILFRGEPFVLYELARPGDRD